MVLSDMSGYSVSTGPYLEIQLEVNVNFRFCNVAYLRFSEWVHTVCPSQKYIDFDHDRVRNFEVENDMV